MFSWLKKKPVKSDQQIFFENLDKQWKPERCPITQRKFFMWLEHPELGWVPTYGGPFDSYTIPEADNIPESGSIEWDHLELTYHQYDHDEGAWKNWVEWVGLRIIDDQKLIKLEQPDAA